MNEPDFLSLEEVIAIHDDQLLRYGGRPGILDMTRLQTAVAMPTTGAGGDYFHTDIFLMAAAYLYHISQDHPFVDGNKRTGVVAAIVFLYLNGLRIETEELDLEEMVISVAEGRTDKRQLQDFFGRTPWGWNKSQFKGKPSTLINECYVPFASSSRLDFSSSFTRDVLLSSMP